LLIKITRLAQSLRAAGRPVSVNKARTPAAEILAHNRMHYLFPEKLRPAGVKRERNSILE